MLKVLVVDDNSLIRKSIVARIDWTSLGMTVIGEAENGKDALDCIMSTHPDIIVTDIKMPIADGFSIIERTKDFLPNLQYIIISGYDDFQYAKKAISYKVINYILKPINDDELLEALKQARENIQNKQEYLHNETQLNQILIENTKKQVEETFKAFFNYDMGFIQLIQTLKSHDYSLPYPDLFCCGINLVHAFNRKGVTIPAQVLEQIEVNLTQLFSHCQCRLIPLQKGVYLTLINLKSHTSLTEHTMCALKDVIASHLPSEVRDSLDVYYGYSSIHGLDDLHMAYTESIDALYMRFSNSYAHSDLFYLPDKEYDYTPFFPEEELAVALKLQSYEHALCLIKDILNELPILPHIIKKNLLQLFQLIDAHIKDFKSLDQLIFIHAHNKDYTLLQFKDKDQIVHTIQRLFDQLKQQKITINLREYVVSYIDKHFTDTINLKTLGSLFHVNHIYLGQLIKKETGISFNKYINKLRIDYAKELIDTNDDILLKDLAYNIGFADSHYFTKVFKGYTGITPTEYRDRRRSMNA